MGRAYEWKAKGNEIESASPAAIFFNDRVTHA